eukprot:scaffold31658_cov28-Tisochrysis_lutea.AAC.3
MAPVSEMDRLCIAHDEEAKLSELLGRYIQWTPLHFPSRSSTEAGWVAVHLRSPSFWYLVSIGAATQLASLIPAHPPWLCPWPPFSRIYCGV